MDACDLEHIRGVLLEKKRLLVQSIKKSLGGSLQSDARMSFELVQDNPDRSVDELLKHVQSHMLGSMGDELETIETALLKIREGTYAQCEACEQPIAARRLQAYPESVYCVACQEDIERHARYDNDSAAFSGVNDPDAHADEED